MTRVVPVALLMLLSSGWTPAFPDAFRSTDSAKSGSVTVILGRLREIAATCAKMTERTDARGCIARLGGDVYILCAYNDVECLAHEMRHALQPHWNHD